MNNINQIPTSRIEAFSDGVIAIIITVMVFDLKLQEIPTDKTVWSELIKLTPKFISYAISFLMLSIMWVNHHQLFHQIKHTDRRLLWYSIHLLFWMSIIPFGTNFIGANPLLWQASFSYGIIFFMNALSFTILRNYVIKSNLLHDSINKQAHIKIRNKNRVALSIYLLASAASLISVYISFVMFLIVPAMYFIPEKINHIEN
ncbi:MAG: TMEM175 family protein [Bacteroidales bacterium]